MKQVLGGENVGGRRSDCITESDPEETEVDGEQRGSHQPENLHNRSDQQGTQKHLPPAEGIDEAAEYDRAKADADEGNGSHDANLGGVSANEIEFRHPVVNGGALVPVHHIAARVGARYVTTASLVATVGIGAQQGRVQLQEGHHVEGLATQDVSEDANNLCLGLVAPTTISLGKRVFNSELIAVLLI